MRETQRSEQPDGQYEEAEDAEHDASLQEGDHRYEQRASNCDAHGDRRSRGIEVERAHADHDQQPDDATIATASSEERPSSLQ